MEVICRRFIRCERVKFLSTPLTVAFSSEISYNAAVGFIIRQADNGELYVLLTKRAKTLNSFAGDVCLPGGMYDPSDDNLVNTAMRESQEEVGIKPTDLSYIGELPPFLAGQGAGNPVAVTPVVFWLKNDSELCINANEVDTTFWTPLSFFLSLECFQSEYFTIATGWKVTVVLFKYFDPSSQRKFLIYGCTGNICVTASSIALNRAPEFPFTGLAFYLSTVNKITFAEISTTPLTTLPQIEDWKLVPYVTKYNSKL